MPGLVIVSRRWNIGSDDIIVPASIYLITHLLWILIYLFICVKNGTLFLDDNCPLIITLPVFGQFISLFGFVILEIFMIKVSLRGSILNTKTRSSLNILIYIWFVLFIIEILWEIYGLLIMMHNKFDSYNDQCASTKGIVIGLKIFLLLIWTSFILFVWCAFDYAGKSWVKMKRFQESLNNPNSKYKYRRSNSFHRNWRHREALRKYQQSWLNRCRWFCCVKDRRDNSFTEIAKLLSEFFRDLDVVPSDVVAGLSLMRVQQKSQRKERMMNDNEEPKIFQFLSGAAITAETKFLDLTHVLVIREVYNLIHYLHYSLAIYGWPMYMVANQPSQWFHLLKHIKCCGNQSSRWAKCSRCCSGGHIDTDTIIDSDDQQFVNIYRESDNILGDNCCLCNRAAIRQTCIDHDYKIIYITYYVAIEKPPFFVAVDYDKMSIVISIRGTLSLYDVLTDLNAEYDLLPLTPPRENWYGHKGMVAAAAYIRSRLIEKHIIEIANEELKIRNLATNSHHQYPIIIVGHSLGAGTAAILAVLLREIYTNVICFAFAPPGGLLSQDLAEYSKDFVISIVLGKDIIPRLGLHQMEKLRFDLIKAIKHCDMSKWPIIFKSFRIGSSDINHDEYVKKFKIKSDNIIISQTVPESFVECKHNNNGNSQNISPSSSQTHHHHQQHQHHHHHLSSKEPIENISTHPNDENIQLTVHTPLYPPGSIIHLVKAHPNKSERIIGQKQFIIQALWAGYEDFDEILISPSMIRDHMPDRILEALESLLINTGPPKPKRKTEDSYDDDGVDNDDNNNNNHNNSIDDSIDNDSKYYSSIQDTNDHIYQQSHHHHHHHHSKRIMLETSFASAIPATSMTTTASEQLAAIRKNRRKKFDNHNNNDEVYNEERLRRLRSFIAKRKAPLATPETVSLTDDVCEQQQQQQQRQRQQKPVVIVSTISNNQFDTQIQTPSSSSSSNQYEQINDRKTSLPEVI
ncbi:sn1-specific diacylglycerol lipase alpha-like protein [Dermatophagoides farinae]|uniref:sn-1-specific diacylglycerol lipase n=1 Tax=Dermatophagoides farinae TaxID=6954 RepID=A0A9D4P6X6_DERFA|nr:diacylglycerol lipase-alpha-like isoform X2 [Dermatophagoides farinae]KAH7644150.1 sn1-specific diacylglycerol lipase alpha-like protein [Dermatophagoides farinae]